MIYPTTYYAAKCDNCGKDWHDEHNGFTAMSDESSTREMIMYDEWHEEDDKHYCPNCFYFDDNDVLQIKTIETK